MPPIMSITVTVKLLTGDLIQIDDFDADTGLHGLAMRISQIDDSLDPYSMNFFRKSDVEVDDEKVGDQDDENQDNLYQLDPYDSIYDGDFLHLLIACRPKITIQQNNCLELCRHGGNLTGESVYYYVIRSIINNDKYAFIDFYVSTQSPDRFYPTNLFKSYTVDDHWEEDYKIEPLIADPLPVIETLEEFLHIYYPRLSPEYLQPILLRWRMGGIDETSIEYDY